MIFPRLVLEKFHWLLGLGKLPDSILLRYLGAGGAFVYGVQGLLLWMIASDVAKYRALVLFAAWTYIVASPVFWFIGARTGMPGWWAAIDTISCLAAGSLLLWACLHRRQTA